MTDAELGELLEFLATLWPSADLGQRAGAGYALMVGDAEFDMAREAVHRLALTGREFPPPPGLLAKMIDRVEFEPEQLAALAAVLGPRADRPPIGRASALEMTATSFDEREERDGVGDGTQGGDAGG